MSSSNGRRSTTTPSNKDSRELIRPGKGKATSSKKPRLDRIPHQALIRLAARYELGASIHGEDNWCKGLDDPTYVLDRISHTINHCYNIVAKIKAGGLPAIKEGDDDAAAVMWGGAFLCEASKK